MVSKLLRRMTMQILKNPKEFQKELQRNNPWNKSKEIPLGNYKEILLKFSLEIIFHEKFEQLFRFFVHNGLNKSSLENKIESRDTITLHLHNENPPLKRDY